MTRDRKVAACLMAGVFLFSALSPMGTSFDSRWTVFVVMSMWRHGTTNLDEDSRQIRESDYYGAECIAADGHVRQGPPETCDGHWYNSYPIGGTILTAPLVLAAVGVMNLLHPALKVFHSGHPVLNGFFRADADAAHPLIEMQVASLLLAVSAAMMYFIARRFLTEKKALALTILYALATPAYSVAGRGLWSHTPSMLLLTIIILMLMRAEEKPWLAAWAGMPVALSYTTRPTDSLFVIVFTIYVAMRYRAYLLRYFLSALPVAILFIGYNESVYHQLLSPYYHQGLAQFSWSDWRAMLVAAAGLLISPSRGLVVYTPVFCFSIWSMVRGLWRTPMVAWLSGLVTLHWVSISMVALSWWGGMCYGPRFFTDVTPVLVLLLIPYIERWEQLSKTVQIVFVSCAVVGFGMHVRGGWSTAVYEWNVKPVSVNEHPERNWEWKDPPFLR